MLAIGLVVDDAIVVVEAVEHHIEEGMSPRDATFKAMSEVPAPVVAIALILAAVFIPVAFMSGITGRLYQQFALTIAVSVLISAFNALTLSPALARCCSSRARRRSAASSAALGRRLQPRLRRARPTATCAINRAPDPQAGDPARAAGWASAALSAAIGTQAAVGLRARRGQGYALIGVQLPDARVAAAHARRCSRRSTRSSGSTEGIRTYNSVAGFSFFTRTAASYAGTGFIGFKPWERAQSAAISTAKAIVAEAERAVRAHPRGARVRAWRRRRSPASARPAASA